MKTYCIRWMEFHAYTIKANSEQDAEQKIEFLLEDGIARDTYQDTSDFYIEEA